MRSGARIAELRERTERLARRSDTLLAAQEERLRQLARARLREQRERLDNYLLHARYGQAQSLDLLYETRGEAAR